MRTNSLIITVSAVAAAAVLAVSGVLPTALAQAATECQQTDKAACQTAGCHWCSVYLKQNGVLSCEYVGQCSAQADCSDVTFGSMADLFSAIPADRNGGRHLSLEIKEEKVDLPCDVEPGDRYYGTPDCESCAAAAGTHVWCQYTVRLDRKSVAEGGLCEESCEKHRVSAKLHSSDFYLRLRQAPAAEDCARLIPQTTTTAEPTTTSTMAPTSSTLTSTQTTTLKTSTSSTETTSTATTTATETSATSTAAKTAATAKPPPPPPPAVSTSTADATTAATTAASTAPSASTGTAAQPATATKTAEGDPTTAAHSAAAPTATARGMSPLLAATAATCLVLASAA